MAWPVAEKSAAVRSADEPAGKSAVELPEAEPEEIFGVEESRLETWLSSRGEVGL